MCWRSKKVCVDKCLKVALKSIKSVVKEKAFEKSFEKCIFKKKTIWVLLMKLKKGLV